jgi:hypothetical protein
MCVFKCHAFIYFLRPPPWSGTIIMQLSSSFCLSNKSNLEFRLLSFWATPLHSFIEAPISLCARGFWIIFYLREPNNHYKKVLSLDVQYQSNERDFAKYFSVKVLVFAKIILFHRNMGFPNISQNDYINCKLWDCGSLMFKVSNRSSRNFLSPHFRNRFRCPQFFGSAG